MAEQDEETPSLSPASVSLLELWMECQKPLLLAPDVAPDEAQLVRYLCGTLSREDVHAVERGLTTHPDLHSTLREIRGRLDAFQVLTWEEVAKRATGEGLDARVAGVWLEIVSERLHAAPRAPHHWLSQGLSAVRRQAGEGIAEAQVAWTAFLAFGRQLKADTARPRFALALGGEASEPLGDDLPSGVQLEVRQAEIVADSSLRVEVVVGGADGKPSQALAGKTLYLSLVFGGESWPVASAGVEGSSVQWNIPSLGAALGLPKGSLPANYLRFSLNQETPPAADGLWLPAEILDAAGRPTSVPPVILTLSGEPRLHGGQFSVSVVVPPEVRAVYADYRLLLDVLVSTRRRQRFGEWSVRDWNDAPRLLTAPCPALAEDAALLPSFLRAQLQP